MKKRQAKKTVSTLTTHEYRFEVPWSEVIALLRRMAGVPENAVKLRVTSTDGESCELEPEDLERESIVLAWEEYSRLPEVNLPVPLPLPGQGGQG